MGLMPDKFVLDTNIVLYFLGGCLAEPLPVGKYGISVITELELLAYPGLSREEADQLEVFISKIAVIDLTLSVKTHAINYRKRLNLKLPDAIIAATARALNATLLSNDQRLLTLSDPQVQSISLIT